MKVYEIMSSNNLGISEIEKKFDERIEQLTKSLPHLEGSNCATLTLMNILEVIGVEKNHHYNNLIFPLAGGFGGFKSLNDWRGPCGAVCGGTASIGLISGGKENITPEDVPKVYYLGSRFCHEFEKEFGSDFMYVTPGIKWAGIQREGQKQLYTPDLAVQDCTSSILVIGGAITKAEDKKATAYEILQAMAPYV